MDSTAIVFLVVGGIGLLILLASLVIGEVGDFLAADADGPFSLPAVAAFIGGIGFGGAATSALLPELPGAAAVLLALLGGLVVAFPLAFGAIRLSAALQHMPTDATLNRHHLLGAVGTVISAIPTNGPGEVRLSVAGQQLKYYARCDGSLPAGTPVYVVDTPSETTVQVVSTAEPSAPGGTTL